MANDNISLLNVKSNSTIHCKSLTVAEV